jgi:hypothetical protein
MTNQGDFTAGDVLQAADLNAFTQLTICRDSQSVPNATNTTVVFTTELVDVGGWHTGTSAQITPDIDGVYLITANAQSTDSVNRALINVYVGSTIVASSDDNSGGFDLSVAVHYPITAGTNVSLVCYQNSGTTKTPTFTLGVQLVRRTS